MESLRSARANDCDEIKRSGRKSAAIAAVEVSLATVSTSNASIVSGPLTLSDNVSSRSLR